MANLTESSTFDAGVYRLEVTDPVEGGESGKANAPLKNLANRTKYLNDRLFGIGQTMSVNQAYFGVTYTNTTAKAMLWVAYIYNTSGSGSVEIYQNNVLIASVNVITGAAVPVPIMVEPGATYNVQVLSGSFLTWFWATSFN
jgi:hypothetical protein